MKRTDRASKQIRAEPDAIYRALTEQEALTTWLPPAGMSGRFAAFDAREGGGYRLVLSYDDPDHAVPGKTSEHSDAVSARFVELVPGKLVVQEVDFDSTDPAFAGTMRMTWSLHPVAGGTEISIVCENVPHGIGREDHEVGLRSSLDNLAAYCESPSADSSSR